MIVGWIKKNEPRVDKRELNEGKGKEIVVPHGHNCKSAIPWELKSQTKQPSLSNTVGKNCFVFHLDKVFLKEAQIFTFPLGAFELI